MKKFFLHYVNSFEKLRFPSAPDCPSYKPPLQRMRGSIVLFIFFFVLQEVVASGESSSESSELLGEMSEACRSCIAMIEGLTGELNTQVRSAQRTAELVCNRQKPTVVNGCLDQAFKLGNGEVNF